MRIALLTLALLEIFAQAHPARADFRCFDAPGDGRRCACVGSGECTEMQKSGDCKTAPLCDKGELGSVICSCKAVRAAGTTH